MTNTITIMRRIKFCAGHRLMGHGGKCENLHGHNYVVDFHITGKNTDSVGRVVDFAILKRLLKGWIDEHWDHGFILSRDDTEAISAVRSVDPHRLYLLPFNPTAENMAKYLLTEIGPKLLTELANYHVKMTRVVLWETEESCAEVCLDSESKIVRSVFLDGSQLV